MKERLVWRLVGGFKQIIYGLLQVGWLLSVVRGLSAAGWEKLPLVLLSLHKVVGCPLIGFPWVTAFPRTVC